ncbi:MAG: peptide chain release factor N(5)-glutamine methyltransferase, partial [Paludibacteraceae bacterium]|nr:peptide chain release factor N(5)-glutamine methyltransferase [Paludibacteraceae bacterium]
MRNITKQLQSVYPADESRALAWWILEETTGLSRTQLLSGDKVTTFSRDMQAIIDRLLQKEPIQYIFGHTLWCGLDLKLTPATLIPRPETAELVAEISNFKFQI